MVSVRTRYYLQYVVIEIDKKTKYDIHKKLQPNCTLLNDRNHYSKEKIKKKNEHENNNNYCSSIHFCKEVNSKYYPDNCENRITTHKIVIKIANGERLL